MSREIAWRRACPEAVTDRINTALSSRIYFLSRSGPTGFVVKEEGAQSRSFKVLLGSRQSCTCPVFLRENELCIHILWVMLKKLRVPRDNPLVYQLSLVEREIQQLLRQDNQGHNDHDSAALPTAPLNAAAAPTVNGDKTALPQRSIADDDICPICQDELLECVFSHFSVVLRCSLVPILDLRCP